MMIERASSAIISSTKTKQPLVVGINGIAGAGKDTISNMVLLSLRNDHGMQGQCFAFANNLKKAASLIFNIPVEDFHDRTKKEEIVTYWNMSPRQMAQQLGTEACRKGIRDDIWIKSLDMSIITANVDIAFITDVRFDNEAEYVKSKNGIVVNLIRDKQDTIKDSSHASEKGIAEKLIDYQIINVSGNTFLAAGELQQIILNRLNDKDA